MKFGFEKEYFLYKKGVLAIVPKNSPLPVDECGFLVEEVRLAKPLSIHAGQ